MQTIKISLLVFLFSLVAFYGLSQSNLKIKMSKCSKEAYTKCNQKESTLHNRAIVKKKEILKIPTAKGIKIFIDDSTDLNFKVYEYLYDISNSHYSLFKQTGYNSEDYFLINSSTGKIDTLIGKPIFSPSYKNLICYNNPATDEKLKIQSCTIENDKYIVLGNIALSGILAIDELKCLDNHSFLVKRNNQFYTITY